MRIWYEAHSFPQVFCCRKTVRFLGTDSVVYFVNTIACEQALYLSLTRDLFWARAASGRERIGAGMS